MPIMAILCDGRSFYFFQFVFDRQGSKSPQFLQGRFPDGSDMVSVAVPGSSTSIAATTQFVREIRYACDGLFFVFLKGYQYGLEAYWNRSVARAKAEGKGRDSTPGWERAKFEAEQALQQAISAWKQFHDGNITGSKQTADLAMNHLMQRY